MTSPMSGLNIISKLDQVNQVFPALDKNSILGKRGTFKAADGPRPVKKRKVTLEFDEEALIQGSLKSDELQGLLSEESLSQGDLSSTLILTANRMLQGSRAAMWAHATMKQFNREAAAHEEAMANIKAYADKAKEAYDRDMANWRAKDDKSQKEIGSLKEKVNDLEIVVRKLTEEAKLVAVTEKAEKEKSLVEKEKELASALESYDLLKDQILEVGAYCGLQSRVDFFWEIRNIGVDTFKVEELEDDLAQVFPEGAPLLLRNEVEGEEGLAAPSASVVTDQTAASQNLTDQEIAVTEGPPAVIVEGDLGSSVIDLTVTSAENPSVTPAENPSVTTMEDPSVTPVEDPSVIPASS